jgi:hypothetical protein
MKKTMKIEVHERVLHIIYPSPSDIPADLLQISDAYEGATYPRIGFNFPFSFLQTHTPRHSLTAYDADYVIGYPEHDILTKRHELQHAKYHMDSTYRASIQTLWDSFPSSFQQKVIQQLLHMKYPNRMEILLDEFQAYYTTEKPNFFGKVRR